MENDSDSSAMPMEQPEIDHITASDVPSDDCLPHSNTENNPVNAEGQMSCGHKMNGRNLVVCIDGTSNQFGQKNTNVIELYNLVLKEVKDRQRTWYNSGIGTYARPTWKSLKHYKQILYHKIDLAIAWNFEKTILGAYRWLSDNYEEDDCIFLFGFSRGAFQVRVLSAMIHKVGLIHKGNEMQIPFAYELYADPKSDEPTVTRVRSTKETPDISMSERFKNAFSHKDVKVHFVGAWDTVSSIGIVRGKQMLPYTVDGMTHVCFFRHALALDERRVKFLPEYAYGDTSQDTEGHPNSTDEVSEDTLRKNSKRAAGGSQTTNEMTRDPPQTLEVWFAGSHSDIGGGNVLNAGMNRTRPSLRWMVFEAGAAGLRTAQFQRKLFSKGRIEFKESLTIGWWPFEIIPFRRLTYTRRTDGTKVTYWCHLGSPRKIQPGQKIHSSLVLADTTHDADTIHDADTTYEAYTPKARPLDNDNFPLVDNNSPLADNNSFWDDLRNGKRDQWLERDLCDRTDVTIKNLSGHPDNTLKHLRQIGTSSIGRQALYEKTIEVLSESTSDLRNHYQLLHSCLDILANKGSELKLSPPSQIKTVVSKLLNSGKEDYRKIAQEFMVQFSDPCIFLHGHKSSVYSVAFSPDGRRIASGLQDLIQVWDVQTGKAVGKPFQGHRGSVSSIAFSPDGKWIASASFDRTVRIWNVRTGSVAVAPFQHKNSVSSVVFSPDGSQIASASYDTKVHIWDWKGHRIWDWDFKHHPIWDFEGHEGPVDSIAFSPDGKRIASGSQDKTVRIWDVETRHPVGGAFEGHTDWVNSVAFSPDGKYIASGSRDNTVRIWDVEEGRAVGVPSTGHIDSVSSVAFSPDGKFMASASFDKTVRLWDVETGKAVRELVQGHRGWISSIAFSLDGKYIASGSHDRTVRIEEIDQMVIPATVLEKKK